MADVKPRVVMTAAAGNVGTTLWRAWEEEGRYEPTLADLQPLSVSDTRSVQSRQLVLRHARDGGDRRSTSSDTNQRTT